MGRGSPTLHFDSFELRIGKEDHYVSNWIKLLEKQFYIIFSSDSISKSYLNNRNSFETKRYFTQYSNFKDNILASFCFNRGSMCKKEISNYLKEKNIKRYAVIYGDYIFEEMSRSIEMGFFDEVIISNFSNLYEDILGINPFQKISKICDSFPLKMSEEIDSLGIIGSDFKDRKFLINSQIKIIKKIIPNTEIMPCNLKNNSIPLFKKGYIVLPQNYNKELVLKISHYLFCKNFPVFVPYETFKLFDFGMPYKNIEEIKTYENMTINKLERINCFSENLFLSQLVSIINRS